MAGTVDSVATKHKSERLVYIDYARGAAMFLAILSHVFIQFAADITQLQLITLMATPTFLVVFGLMIDLVYFRKLDDGTDMHGMRVRLLARGMVCYAAYFALAAAAFVGGKAELREFVVSLVSGNGRFGTILVLYTIVLGFVALFLPLLHRGGAWVFAGIAIAGWGLKYLFGVIDPEANAVLRGITGHGYGAAPSVLPAFTFVAFGVLLGEALRGKRNWRLPTLAIALAAAVFAAGMLLMPLGIDYGAALYDLRMRNDPLYYTFGITASCLLLYAGYVLFNRVGAVRLQPLGQFGTASLFFYAFANFALNLLPLYPAGGMTGLAIGLAFLMAMIWLTLDWSSSRSLADRVSLGLVRGLFGGVASVCGGVAAFAIRVVETVPFGAAIYSAAPRTGESELEQDNPDTQKDARA